MFKKFVSVILAMLLLGTTAFANLSFSDLGLDHWGYSSVDKLVTDGTVKGYEDGTFRPDNTVTRAEFVKMMGKGTEVRSSDFSDVPKDHWGYDYIMTSGFAISGNQFKPDQPITRGEAIELLWKRGGGRTDIVAPSIIAKQHTNEKAAAWAYNFGIMVGNDGLNLRFADSVTRVEAAALIIRARETDFSKAQNNFVDTVSPELLKTIFNSFRLFNDITYDPNRTITNGEMARAALRLASYEYNLTYSSFVYKTTFTHTYAKDVTIIANRCLGDGIASAEFADKTATVEDALSAFAFASIQRANKSVSFGNVNNYYPDVPQGIDSKKNVFLTFAKESGIYLKGNGLIGAGNNVTLKDLAAILLQIDYLTGTQTIFSTKKDDKGRYIKTDARLVHDLTAYPKNANQFACIIAGVDNKIYEAPITGKAPAGNYDFTREYGEMFVSKMDQIVTQLRTAYGVEAELLIYPNLVWDNGNGFSIRMLCKILENPAKSVSVESVFEELLMEPVEGDLKAGMEFFIEIKVGYAIFM